ncbi:MAG: class I SAM-dependent DNA methyltransferase [Betaproteobacteria bacterium]|nr:class I SAM-dependent DNA methyltransferase [Betaproteobacteria bacterium]
MRLSWEAIQANAIAFAKRWKDARRENADAQAFVTEFLGVFGVPDPVKAGEREKTVKISGAHDRYIDFFWKRRIAIEMKSRGKDLGDAYQQLKGYMDHVPVEDTPDLWMVSDFETVQLWRRSTSDRFTFKLKDFRKHIRRFSGIAGYDVERIRDDQVEVNIKAAEKMARLHDTLKARGYEGHDLEVYLVRLLFCLFADDTGIFPQDSFFRYLERTKSDGSDLSERIGKLFEVLNMPEETRAKRVLLSSELRQFRYINGRLFSTMLPMAEFDRKMRQTLLDCVNFDWSRISPAIFGAMFQGVMDKRERRELGAHYTSEENILKLINPLFMDDLWREFERVKADPAALDRFHEKLSRLKFLDPACGCGNFLIIAYRELRVLELEVLKMKIGAGQMVIDISPLLKVSVEQFCGIELEDFPCQIAQVGMWLIDHQMNLRASEQFGTYYARLPLVQSATIVHGNALRIDWESVVPKEELSFILGNPPFIGYSNQSEEQKADVLSVYVDRSGKPFKNAGKIDYVAAWYYKAAEYMVGQPLDSFKATNFSQNRVIRAAFVSTNSITQGEQVAAVWKPLFEMFGVQIDFCYRTFKWSNEAKGKAAAHCVIVGFSQGEEDGGATKRERVLSPLFKGCGGVTAKGLSGSDAGAKGSPVDHERVIYDTDGTKIPAQNINPYLVDAPDVFVESRRMPICDVPEISRGSDPVDGGYLIIEENEYNTFIKAEPFALPYIKRFMMGDEFINNKKRWCLWLVSISPSIIKKMPLVMGRIEGCQKFRLGSKKEATRKYARYPSRFMETRQPDTDYIAIPKVSSERRHYIPIGYLDKDIIAGDKLFTVMNASKYHFGVLTSNVHMAWTRVVCGRLKSDYSYSNTIVYNNFPWSDATNKQKANIEKLAQAILDARALFPESSLADLYDPLTMPPELLKAHHNLDRAVMKLYGFTKDMSEAEIVAALMARYKKLVER